MTPALPPDAEKYSETDVFTQDTIPMGLLKDHQTSSRTWGLIVVTEGTLSYTRPDGFTKDISAGNTAVILPAEPHSVAAKGQVAFKVEFYHRPGDPANKPVDQKV